MVSSLDTTSSPKPKKRIPGLDGLRGIAAFLVLVTHVRQILAVDLSPAPLAALVGLGGEGLTLFFVLSGFLLYLPFGSAILAGKELPSVKRYATNRLIRIVPGYLSIFFLVAFVIGVAVLRPAQLGETAVDRPVGYFSDPLHILANLLLLQTYFPDTVTTGITPAWSLTVEIAFYASLPLAAWFAVSLGKRSGFCTIVLASIPGALFLVLGLIGQILLRASVHPADNVERYWAFWGDTGSAVWARSFITNAHLFAPGMFAAVVYALARSGRISTKSAEITGIAVLASGFVFAPLSYLAGWTSVSLAVLFAGVVLTISSLGLRKEFVLPVRILEARWMQWMGLVSYSTYLWHLPVILWLRQQGLHFDDDTVGFLANTAIVAAITFALAAVTYTLVEAPALSLKNRIGKRSTPVSTSTSSPSS